MDYGDETLFTEKGLSNRVENMVKMAAVGGEPMKSCYAYEDMERMLDRLGLLIYEHLSPTAIQELYFQNRTDYLCAFETIHYMHIVKNRSNLFIFIKFLIFFLLPRQLTISI